MCVACQNGQIQTALTTGKPKLDELRARAFVMGSYAVTHSKGEGLDRIELSCLEDGEVSALIEEYRGKLVGIWQDTPAVVTKPMPEVTASWWDDTKPSGSFKSLKSLPQISHWTKVGEVADGETLWSVGWAKKQQEAYYNTPKSAYYAAKYGYHNPHEEVSAQDYYLPTGLIIDFTKLPYSQAPMKLVTKYAAAANTFQNGGSSYPLEVAAQLLKEWVAYDYEDPFDYTDKGYFKY